MAIIEIIIHQGLLVLTYQQILGYRGLQVHVSGETRVGFGYTKTGTRLNFWTTVLKGVVVNNVVCMTLSYFNSAWVPSTYHCFSPLVG